MNFLIKQQKLLAIILLIYFMKIEIKLNFIYMVKIQIIYIDETTNIIETVLNLINNENNYNNKRKMDLIKHYNIINGNI